MSNILDAQPQVSTDVGIVEVSAKIVSDSYSKPFFMSPTFATRTNNYHPNIKLTITIADNENYNDATVYESNFVQSGSTVEYTHALTNSGTYYIKMETVDAEGGSIDILEYTIDAVIKPLYFLEEPEVNTQSVQANSVTVRSSTAEYTATTTPAPNADELIERLVEIEEGDQAACQEIAESLIAKWGREQKSVSGNINLTVSLRFREKVRVVIPQSNIDEEMILQKKEHDVTGRVTTVTCGDIILSDDELLARILDEIGA